MILHIFNYDKFTEPYIEFIDKNFDINQHIFFIVGNSEYYINKNRKNVFMSDGISSIPFIISKMNSSDKIIIHGLFNRNIVLLLFSQPWLLKKCNWVIWGGDLYCYRNPKKKIRSKLYEWIRKFIIKNISGIITHVKGDYELAKLWYKTKAKYYYSFMYPSNLYKQYNLQNIKKDKSKLYIQIGNSADPTNNHIEVFHKLEKYKNKNIEIICPLSYGNREYRDKVITEGRKIFGNKFNPIVNFMPFSKYLELLAKIDIAIFNHNRQQALGNITTLLGLGKTVYIRDDIVTWNFCKEHKLKVYKINQEELDILKIIDEKDKYKNIKNIKNDFSIKKLLETQINIFQIDN